jgi:hypothetical protein
MNAVLFYLFKELKRLENTYIQKPFIRKEWGKVKKGDFQI